MQIPRDELAQALASLYDCPALAECALTQRFADMVHLSDPVSRGQRLRAILMDALEALQPPRPRAVQTPATRGYTVLTKHYVDGLTIASVAEELSISERQAYRDMARALDSLAGFLEAYNASSSPALPQSAGQEIRRELERLTLETSLTDVTALLQSALDLVGPLAASEAVRLEADMPADTLLALVSPGMFKQTLVQALSVAVRAASRSAVRATATGHDDHVTISIACVAASRSAVAEALDPVRDLARAQGLVWRTEWGRLGELLATLSVPRRRQLAMVVEDNESAIELYHRFLASRDDWELISVRDAQAVLPTAAKRQPTVILLDIMMPEFDGWSLLQMLKMDPETAGIPVLVCTVFDEYKLAMALGAAAFLKKPLTRTELLTALDRCAQTAGRRERPPVGPSAATASIAPR